MKKHLLLLAISCGALAFSGCVYDDGYGVTGVSVSTGSPYYYGSGFDEYSPYYYYGGRRYYRTGGRYVYYYNRRPVYVTRLPSGANYIRPHARYRSSDYYRGPTRYYRDSERRSSDGRSSSVYRDSDRDWDRRSDSTRRYDVSQQRGDISRTRYEAVQVRSTKERGKKRDDD